jgi:hypothetical protein
MRLLRTLLAFSIGSWLGMIAASEFVKRAVPSRGDEESDELALVAVRDGIDLRSRAAAFRGGSMLAWFGGIAVDLRETQLAPGARLRAHTLFGGIALKVPSEWRIESSARTLAGGVDIRPATSDTDESPVLTLESVAVFGGVSVSR